MAISSWKAEMPNHPSDKLMFSPGLVTSSEQERGQAAPAIGVRQLFITGDYA